MTYIERHIITYNPQQIKPEEMKEFLGELNLAAGICFNGSGSLVLKIPETAKSSIERLEERFGDQISITPEALPI